MTEEDRTNLREVVDSQVALGHKMTLVPTDVLVRLLATPAPLAPHPGESHDYEMTCRRCGERGYLFVGFHSPGETFRWSEAQPKEADHE